jgi:hypothetical protein
MTDILLWRTVVLTILFITIILLAIITVARS